MDEKKDTSNAWNRERFRLVYETPHAQSFPHKIGEKESYPWIERDSIELTRAELFEVYTFRGSNRVSQILEKLLRFLLAHQSAR